MNTEYRKKKLLVNATAACKSWCEAEINEQKMTSTRERVFYLAT
jgi:hypothetical protein